MSRRRAFLACLAMLIAGRGNAQSRRLPRIGYLLLGPVVEPPSRERQAFLDGMRELGYVPGRTVEIVYASAENEPDFMDDVARELVRQKPDVVVVSGAVAALAAKKATNDIPIVALAVGDPVGIGVVRSLARPEANVTGLSFISSELAGKRVQLIVDILPAARRVAVLWDERNANARAEASATLAALGRTGLSAMPFHVASGADLQRALADVRNARPHVLYVVFEGGTVGSNRSEIAEFGLRERIAVISGWSYLTEAGGLASYAPDLPASFRRSSWYVHRILNGAAPHELPIEQASTVEMVVNLRTANALGVPIPDAVRVRADRLIR